MGDWGVEQLRGPVAAGRAARHAAERDRRDRARRPEPGPVLERRRAPRRVRGRSRRAHDRAGAHQRRAQLAPARRDRDPPPAGGGRARQLRRRGRRGAGPRDARGDRGRERHAAAARRGGPCRARHDGRRERPVRGGVPRPGRQRARAGLPRMEDRRPPAQADLRRERARQPPAPAGPGRRAVAQVLCRGPARVGDAAAGPRDPRPHAGAPPLEQRGAAAGRAAGARRIARGRERRAASHRAGTARGARPPGLPRQPHASSRTERCSPTGWSTRSSARTAARRRSRCCSWTSTTSSRSTTTSDTRPATSC